MDMLLKFAVIAFFVIVSIGTSLTIGIVVTMFATFIGDRKRGYIDCNPPLLPVVLGIASFGIIFFGLLSLIYSLAFN
jgi:hypothetical protein